MSSTESTCNRLGDVLNKNAAAWAANIVWGENIVCGQNIAWANSARGENNARGDNENGEWGESIWGADGGAK